MSRFAVSTALRRAAAAALSVAALVVVTGCAHPISITPNTPPAAKVATKIDKSVAYVISPADMALEVTSPGGGGDKVKYLPYRDLDASLYASFSEVFKDVTKAASVDEAKALSAKGVKLVIVPTIVTTSSSDSAFTWPPTQFSVTLTCTAVNPQGQQVAQVSAMGNGAATFSEFKSDFSLAARRASRAAVEGLTKALADNEALRR